LSETQAELTRLQAMYGVLLKVRAALEKDDFHQAARLIDQAFLVAESGPKGADDDDA
jgi:hypothetical protein